MCRKTVQRPFFYKLLTLQSYTNVLKPFKWFQKHFILIMVSVFNFNTGTSISTLPPRKFDSETNQKFHKLLNTIMVDSTLETSLTQFLIFIE